MLLIGIGESEKEVPNTIELKAEISKKISIFTWVILATYTVIALSIIIAGFSIGEGSSWFEIPFWSKYSGKFYPDQFVIVITIITACIAAPILFILLCNRKRKLTELTVSKTEVVGSYTAFIPVSKITLRMPIEKIDNVSALNSVLFFFTGKAIKIKSTSGVIRIPYVLNADEIVAFISEAIQKPREEKEHTTKNNESAQNDYTDSLKKLAELRDAGIITEEEFNQKKAELLGKI